MAAAQELLVNVLVTASAIARGELRGDHESVVIFLLLARCRLVTFETVDPLAGVGAHLVFVDNRILSTSMALGALTCSPDEIGRGLFSFRLRTGAIDQECGENQGKGDDDGNED